MKEGKINHFIVDLFKKNKMNQQTWKSREGLISIVSLNHLMIGSGVPLIEVTKRAGAPSVTVKLFNGLKTGALPDSTEWAV